MMRRIAGNVGDNNNNHVVSVSLPICDCIFLLLKFFILLFNVLIRFAIQQKKEPHILCSPTVPSIVWQPRDGGDSDRRWESQPHCEWQRHSQPRRACECHSMCAVCIGIAVHRPDDARPSEPQHQRCEIAMENSDMERKTQGRCICGANAGL